MSEKKLFPAELRVLLLAGAVGVMVTAGWLAAMAALMIFPAATLNRSLFGIFSFAPPLAAVVMSGLITMSAYILLCFAFGWVEMYPILKRGKKARAKA